MSRRMPSPSVGLRATLRQLIAQPAVMLSTGAIVLVAALGLSALPRSLELASRDDLRQTLTQAEIGRRSIAVSHEDVHRPGPGADPLSQIRDRGLRFADQEMSDGLRSLVESQNMVVDSPQFAILHLPGTPERSSEPVFLDFRLLGDTTDLVQVARGRLPQPTESIEAQFECPPEEVECPPVELPVFEIALTSEMSAATHLGLEDRALLVPDRSDRAWEGVPLRQLDAVRLVVEVAAIVELADPDLDVWFGDRRLHFPREVFLDLDNQWIEGTALLSPAAYGDVLEALGGGGPPWWRYAWRFFIDSEGVARSDLAEFSADLGLLRLAHSVSEPGSGALVLATRLPELVDEHLGQRAQTLRIMALTVAGIVATVSLATLALGVLMTERQRDQIVLARDRGASAPQVTTTRLYQALLMTLPPVVGAYMTTSLLLDDTAGATAYAIVLVLAVAVIAALLVPILGLARRPLGSIRSEESWRSASPRRNVFEVALVFLAVVCVVLVRQRDPRATTDFDWLLVATPAVVGAAAGAITIRLAGPLALGLAWLSARARGAVSFLALRRSVRQSLGARTPLAVLVVCMATASLSVLTLRSIETGQEVGSWQEVGADFSVTSAGDGTPLSGMVTPEALGVDEVVSGATSAVRATLNQQRGPVTLWAVEASKHDEAFGDTPGDLGLGSLVAPTPTGELPAIVSDTWANRLRPQVGQVITVSVGDAVVTVEVVAVRPSLPGMDRWFVVVDKDRLEAATGEPVLSTQALVRGPRSLGPGITEAVADAGATVTSRYAVLDRLAEDPMVKWAGQGMSAGWLLAAGVGALSIVAALALGAARRRRDLGLLKTMGLENRGATAMTLIEQIPGVALATAIGLVTGAATLVAIRPSLDLGVLTGQRSSPVTIDWGLLGVVFLLALALLTVSGVIFVLVNRRQDLGQTLRVGEE